MTIRKKSLTATLPPHPEAGQTAVRPTPGTSGSAEAQPPKQVLKADDVTLSKRTVSRILLAKSLFGR